MVLKVIVFVATVGVLASGHGYLKDPPARTAIHLHPEFNTREPYVLDYSGIQCNSVLQDVAYSSCGRCGEAPGSIENSQGGVYDKGVIVATYQSGTVLEITAEFLAAHFGHFEVELCPEVVETDDCFRKLPIVNASEVVRDGNRVCVPYNNGDKPNDMIWTIVAQVLLPTGIRCERCTIRWNYRTSYPGRQDWEMCDNPNPTQIFRNCADVRIV